MHTPKIIVQYKTAGMEIGRELWGPMGLTTPENGRQEGFYERVRGIDLRLSAQTPSFYRSGTVRPKVGELYSFKPKFNLIIMSRELPFLSRVSKFSNVFMSTFPPKTVG